MQKPPILSHLVLALLLHAGHAMALGFGEVTGSTALGHPLGFSVNLRFDTEGLEPGCVAAEVVVGDRPLPADQVRARLVRVGSSGERRIRVTTTVSIDEPTLTVTVHAGCPAELTRSFVVFADPPQMLARSGDPESGAADDEVGLRPVSPPVAAVPDEPAPPASRASRPRRAVAVQRRDAVAAPPVEAVPPIAAAAPVSPRKPKVPLPVPPAPTSRPVLQLDPREDEAVPQPSLGMASAPGTAPAASGALADGVDPEVVQRLADQARLKALEAAVQQLREKERAKEQSLIALQAQVRAAERDRYAHAVTYTLGGLCAVLAAGLVWMLRLRRRDREQASWWAAAAAAANADLSEPAQPPAPSAAAPPAAVSAPVAHPQVAAPLPQTDVLQPPPVDMRTVRTALRPQVAPAELRRPMSAEELIDLEQQVDFFVVLGQDEAAIDLLMVHIRSTSGVSPLPYLKLLEIYRRRAEREPYERIRERFNRRFNAYAPEWGVDPEAGRDLVAYPEVLKRLQDTWQTPSVAVEMLDTLLFRRGAGPTFDVPAYRELLFLHGIAGDQAERDFRSTGVDLLLPLGGDEVASDLSISRPFGGDAADLGLITLDLDVSTDMPPNLTVEMPHAPERGRVLDFQMDERDLPPRR